MRRASWALGTMLLACVNGTHPAASKASSIPKAIASGARPYTVRLPKGYDGTPAPLVLALHGRGGSGAQLVDWWGLGALADAKRFLLVAPDGTSSRGSTFWSATDACCDFDETGVDDAGYLTRILDEVTTKYRVDEKRIYVVGYSSGAAMAHRMACDASTRIAAVVSLEGAGWKDPTKCRPSALVAMVEVHGTSDEVVAYDGGGPVAPRMGVYPGAAEAMTAWAARNGCTGALTPTGETAHFIANLPPNETWFARFGRFPAGGDVELWTVNGGPHFPELLPAWSEAVWGFLAANPKP